jgi:SAM-dependent methyltransferase
MEKASAEKSIISFGSWLDTPVGRYVREWEHQRLDELTADIFGFNATQVGVPEIDALRANRMPHTWTTIVGMPAEGHDNEAKPLVVVQQFDALPFASASIDLVVLPHVLEFAEEPHQILREVERVLIPEGQLIICGFNPVSLWGARRLWGRWNDSDFLPSGELISLPRLKDWLKFLSMEVNDGYFGCYAPPCETEKWLQRFAFMENVGDRWWPFFGGVYVLQAIKRVRGMHLVGPALRTKKAAAPQGVPATNKIHKQRTK